MADDGPSSIRKNARFDCQAFIAKYGAMTTKYPSNQTIYAQGDPAHAFYYIIRGSTKVTVCSEHGREAVLALLQDGDFFGEECLDPHPRRGATVTTETVSEIARFDRNTIVHALEDDRAFAKLFLTYVLHQSEKLREDLVDQLFYSSEKRLARILLTLSNSEASDEPGLITAPITQETLAAMVGTTRSRINQFMTKFRKLGYIEYDGQIRVHSSLQNVLSSSQPHRAASEQTDRNSSEPLRC